MAECYTPLELAEQACRRAGGNEEQETEIRVLREDIRLTTLIAESGQARLTGNTRQALIHVLAEIIYRIGGRLLQSGDLAFWHV